MQIKSCCLLARLYSFCSNAWNIKESCDFSKFGELLEGMVTQEDDARWHQALSICLRTRRKHLFLNKCNLSLQSQSTKPIKESVSELGMSSYRDTAEMQFFTLWRTFPSTFFWVRVKKKIKKQKRVNAVMKCYRTPKWMPNPRYNQA